MIAIAVEAAVATEEEVEEAIAPVGDGSATVPAAAADMRIETDVRWAPHRDEAEEDGEDDA